MIFQDQVGQTRCSNDQKEVRGGGSLEASEIPGWREQWGCPAWQQCEGEAGQKLQAGKEAQAAAGSKVIQPGAFCSFLW